MLGRRTGLLFLRRFNAKGDDVHSIVGPEGSTPICAPKKLNRSLPHIDYRELQRLFSDAVKRIILKSRAWVIGLVALLILVHVSAHSASCLIPPPGIVSWWRGEGTGLDAVGIHHGTVMGGGGFTLGKVGRAFSFSGSGDDFIGLPVNLFPMPKLDQNGNAPFSFETWFKTTASGVILGQQDQPPFNTVLSGNVAALYVGTNGLLYAEFFWGAENPLQTTNSVADGEFHHVAVTYDGSWQRLYLDGNLLGSQSFAQIGYANDYFYQIGTGWSDGWPETPGGWFPFNGLIDESAYYSRALTLAEVQALYQAGSAGKCAPPDVPTLVHRYSFNQAPGQQTVTDSISGSDGFIYFASSSAPWTNGTPDGSDFTGSGTLRLNGTSGYVDLPPRLVSWFSNATFEAWIKWFGPSTSVWQRAWDFGSSNGGTNAAGNGTNYVIFTPARGGTELPSFQETTVDPFGSEVDPDSLILSGTGKFPVGQEVYVAVTYDPGAGNAQMYFNGNLVSSTNKSLNPLIVMTDYNNWLGRSQWTRDPFFNGEYNEFRIWDGALTSQDIANHYAAGPDQQFVRVRPYIWIQKASSEVVISWFTNYAEGFTLQSISNLTLNNWSAVTNAPIVTNGSYFVTLTTTNTRAFYRLAR